MNETGRPLALVTGASAGIGLEIARELARRGHDLVVTGRSERTGEAAAQLREHGVDVVAVRADLSRPDEVEALWTATTDLGRPLEVAVLNAGIGTAAPSPTSTWSRTCGWSTSTSGPWCTWPSGSCRTWCRAGAAGS